MILSTTKQRQFFKLCSTHVLQDTENSSCTWSLQVLSCKFICSLLCTVHPAGTYPSQIALLSGTGMLASDLARWWYMYEERASRICGLDDKTLQYSLFHTAHCSKYTTGHAYTIFSQINAWVYNTVCHPLHLTVHIDYNYTVDQKKRNYYRQWPTMTKH